MASNRPGLCYYISVVFVILVIILNATPTIMAAEEFNVGDDLGWRHPSPNQTDIYNLWASRRKFHVGDSLRFEYKNDSVIVVDKWGYFHCNTSSPVSGYTDGNSTLISLDKAGPMYFVSGDPDHCKDGQRLLIEVLPLYPPSDSPPAIASPPEGISPASSPLSNSAAKKTFSSFGGVVSTMMAFVVTAYI
ncbi:hypothetical protein ACH5RR_024474 [Cinchona calisaya]|uniref:Phytocyanin domain-containing protein n=1 Tax=Cinchona calisaya TaxID=153742 RepID=A0ABD2Z0Y3_9GENT